MWNVKVAQLCLTLCDAIESMQFSRPEYWSGWPFPSPGDLPNLGTKPRSSALQVDSLPAEPQGTPKNPPAKQKMRETQVHCLGQKDPLEEKMITHSSVLAWITLWDRGAWWATVHVVTKSRTQLRTHSHTHTYTDTCTQREYVSTWLKPNWS